MTSSEMLIVEDELIVAMDLKMILPEPGYVVAEAASTPEEVIRRAREECLDLILTAISLPDLTDWQEAAAIRRQSNVPIIFITGWSDSSIVSQAQKISPGGCLLKPVAPEDLLQVVTNAIERSRLER